MNTLLIIALIFTDKIYYDECHCDTDYMDLFHLSRQFINNIIVHFLKAFN